MLLDIHSHHAAPYPEGIISVSPTEYKPVEGQLYSVGIHPWATAEEGGVTEEMYAALSRTAADAQVVAIGECGVDIVKGGPMFRQLQLFKRHYELSEELGKPLVIHCVKAYDVILGLKRDLQPKQPWVIHGFRGKPSAAEMLVKAGIGVSFGERFNAESVKVVPDGLLYAETDESALPISDIIAALSASAGRDLAPVVAAAVQAFCRLRQ